MAEYIERESLWDDITPTADEFCDFLRRQPSSST